MKKLRNAEKNTHIQNFAKGFQGPSVTKEYNT